MLCPPGAYQAVKQAVPIDFTSDPFADPDVTFEVAPGVGELESALTVRRGKGVTLVLNDLLANVRHPRGLGARAFGAVQRTDARRFLGAIIAQGAAAGAKRRQHQAGKDERADHAPTANTRQAATTTTQTSEVGRKIFQPRRISWS